MIATKKRTSSPYSPARYLTIDEYHAAFPEDIQDVLQQLRQTIKQVATAATEVISYNMPAFKQHKILVYYAAHKKHIGFYPSSTSIKAFEKELINFKTSKGAIQFPIDEPLPTALIKKIVRYRLAADKLQASASTKKSSKKE